MKYRDIPPYGLRLQPDLKAKLEAIVKEKKQQRPDWSLNAEIEERLANSLAARSELKDFSDGELIDELIRRWGRDGVYIQLGSEKTTPP